MRKSYELVDGQLVERNMGAESSEVGGNLYFQPPACSAGSGISGNWPADNGYQCFPHALGLVRRPDVSFIRRGRLPGDVSPDGWIKIPPDLAVEVVSPNDVVEELEAKLEDYQKARIPLVWVIYPEATQAAGLPPRRHGSRLE